MKQAAWLVLGALLLAVPSARGQKSPGPALQKLFLYRVQPVRPDMLKTAASAEESKILDQHFDYLKDLTAKGVVILAGRTLNTDETSFGIVIFHAESEEAARRIMEGDPAVQNGVFHAALFPFRIVLVESTQGE
jgi:uncharacterized protein YciI